MIEVRGEVRQSRADGQDQVGPAADRRRLRRAGPPERPDVERVRVGHRVVAPVGGDHRDRHQLAQAHDEVAGLGPAHAAADQQQRALGLAQQAGGLADRVGMRWQRVGDAVGGGGDRRRRRHALAEHVARDLDEDRPAPAAHRGAQRGPEQLGDALDLLDLYGHLGDRAEHPHQVELLECVLALVGALDAADQADDRGVGDVRRRHAGQQIGGAGPARHQADARLPGHAGQAVGHEGRRLLVTDVDVLHAAVAVERVEDVQERRADDPEDVADPLGPEQIDDQAAAGDVGHQNHRALSTTLRSGWPARKRRALSSRTSKRRSSR